MRIRNPFLYILIMSIIGISSSIAQKSEFRKTENKSFTVGETLTFEVKYGFVIAGVAEYSIPKIVKIAGRDVYNVNFNVSSNPAFDPFYKVRIIMKHILM